MWAKHQTKRTGGCDAWSPDPKNHTLESVKETGGEVSEDILATGDSVLARPFIKFFYWFLGLFNIPFVYKIALKRPKKNNILSDTLSFLEFENGIDYFRGLSNLAIKPYINIIAISYGKPRETSVNSWCAGKVM